MTNWVLKRVSLPALETLGYDNQWVAPFGNSSLLTSVTLGPKLATIAGGQGLGKVKPATGTTAIYGGHVDHLSVIWRIMLEEFQGRESVMMRSALMALTVGIARGDLQMGW